MKIINKHLTVKPLIGLIFDKIPIILIYMVLLTIKQLIKDFKYN